MNESIDQLRCIFTEHPAGIAATKPLRKGVCVGLKIHGVDELFTFERTAEGVRINGGKQGATDFDLVLGSVAVANICSTDGDSVGDFGVSFLKALLRETDDERVQVKLNAGMMSLARNGYLKVLAMGGPKVLGFLAKEGYIGPRGIAKAVRRLRNS
jgi:hypothetical protein